MLENTQQYSPPIEFLNLQEATEFFSVLYGGEHHIPSNIKNFGRGFSIDDRSGNFATTDGNRLTRFVIMCHDQKIRGEIMAGKSGTLKICIWKRNGNTGDMDLAHPTLEDATELIRRRITIQKIKQKI